MLIYSKDEKAQNEDFFDRLLSFEKQAKIGSPHIFDKKLYEEMMDWFANGVGPWQLEKRRKRKQRKTCSVTLLHFSHDTN